MRLLTWNINGVRTLPMYHPWNNLKTGENILNELGADIICFQEVKASRQTLDKSFALPESYDAFFSFPTTKGGYSGTAVYTKISTACPLKVEEGLSGTLQSGLKPPLTVEERVSSSYPEASEMSLVEDEFSSTHLDPAELDKEGRALVLDFGLFVLFNLYCPNETSDARLPYKMNYNLLLAERVRRLVEIDKREVIVTGDMNVCAAPIDHCDGELPSNRDEFWVHPARKWFHEWLDPIGPMVDVLRRRWPNRKGMYTCWDQKIMARETNYGTRIDYFLLTKGLLPWFKDGDILPSIKGSDHCPVFIDLHDEIVTEAGQTHPLKEAMQRNCEPRAPPRLAARYWSEYSGKQKLLSTFFGKKAQVAAAKPEARQTPVSVDKAAMVSSAPPVAMQSPNLDTAEVPTGKNIELISDDEISILPSSISSAKSTKLSLSPSNLTATSSSSTRETKSPSQTSTAKRKKPQADSNYPSKSKKLKNTGSAKKSFSGSAQTKLSSFFAAPSSSRIESTPRLDNDAKLIINTDEVTDVDASIDAMSEEVALSQPSVSPSDSASYNRLKGKGKDTQAWSTLFAKTEPPKCLVHNEPARQFTVNKPGPNKGKTFFVCSRPVGPGYDAGRDKRLREEVDPRYRCNFFKWTSEVRREAARESGKGD